MAVKILHIADLHLDSSFKSIAKVSQTLAKDMKKASQQSFVRLIDYAISNHVDIVVIVGDSFNSDKPSVATQLFFKEQLQRVIDKNIQIVLCFGNHDYVHQSLLVPLQQEVHIFTETVQTYTIITKSNEKVDISGFSYYTNHVLQRKILEYPQKNQADFHIGLLHGELLATGSGVGNYAPFTLQQLNEKHYDYWALGHIHQRQLLQIQPPIAYSGSIQGLNRKETGNKGGYLVTLRQQQLADVTPVNTANLIWEQYSMTVTSQMSIESIIANIKEYFNRLSVHKKYLISLNCNIKNGVSSDIVDTIMSDEFLQILSINNVTVNRVHVHMTDMNTPIVLNDDMQKIWQNIVKNGLNDNVYKEIMADVFNHNVVKTLLPELKQDSSIKEDIIDWSIARIQKSFRGGNDAH